MKWRKENHLTAVDRCLADFQHRKDLIIPRFEKTIHVLLGRVLRKLVDALPLALRVRDHARDYNMLARWPGQNRITGSSGELGLWHIMASSASNASSAAASWSMFMGSILSLEFFIGFSNRSRY